MTEATYRALSEAAVDEITKLSAIGVCPEDIVAERFLGYAAGTVNEGTGTMFRAAINGLYDLPDIDPGTLVVTNDDNQAKVYAVGLFDGLATQLHDTGLTVSFKRNLETMIHGPNTAAQTAAGPLFPSEENTSRYIESSFTTEYYSKWLQDPFQAWSHSPFRQALETRDTGSVKNVKPQKQAEGKPDTAALDEFLSSFKVLAPAT